MKSDRVYLEQILESIGKAQVFVGGMDYAAFSNDQKTQSALIMQLALIGEMAKKISDPTKRAIKMPWKEITGFRDRAIHDYYQIDLRVAWDTVTLDLLPLGKAIHKYLKGAA